MRHDLYMCPQEEFDAEIETKVDSHAKGTEPVFLTAAGLPEPGSTASYLVRAVNEEDREKSSNVVVITRPAAE